MNTFLDRQCRWLLPTILILFILEVITFPFVFTFTWAGKSESPKLILTYTKGNLRWNREAIVDENGTAELSLFDSIYQNVTSDSGENVVAPGTQSNSIVRLKNSTSGEIKYTALLYTIRSTNSLPVEVRLSGELIDAKTYTLPDGIDKRSVIRAVSGTVSSNSIEDFNIEWNWQFEIDDEQDKIDTYLGNKATDDVKVGLYIVVEDNGKNITPKPPKTGDTGVGVYITLMIISGFMVILLLIINGRNKKCEE